MSEITSVHFSAAAWENSSQEAKAPMYFWWLTWVIIRIMFCEKTTAGIVQLFLSVHHCPTAFFISSNLLNCQRLRSYPVPIAECPFYCKIVLQPLCLVRCDGAVSMPGELGVFVFDPPSEKRTVCLLLAVLRPCCSQRRGKAGAVPEGTEGKQAQGLLKDSGGDWREKKTGMRALLRIGWHSSCLLPPGTASGVRG